jgi:hypothetical protein
MARFPKREADVYALAQEMIAGYKAKPAIFVHADVPALETVLAEYQDARRVMLCYEALAKYWIEDKDFALDGIKTLMKQELAKSEIDTTNNPKQLKLIGWGPKAEAHRLVPPGMPRNLEILRAGKGTIELDWKAPASQSGGQVRNFVVLRRDKPAPGQPFGPWQDCQAALETETFITNQPRGINLEYRIVAVNAAGNSVPSNTAEVVL